MAPVCRLVCGASAGNCSAGGDYDYAYNFGFVVSEKNGVWRKAITVPGLGSPNKGRHAGVESVSCASAGNCAAGGYYSETGRHLLFQGFVT